MDRHVFSLLPDPAFRDRSGTASFISREPERPDRNGFWHKTAAGWRCSQPAEIDGDHNSLTQKMLALNSDGLMLHTLRGG
jgi:hypothetical protein